MERIQPGPSRLAPLLTRLRRTDETVLVYGAGVYAHVVARYLEASGIGVGALVVDRRYVQAAIALGRRLLIAEDAGGDLQRHPVVVGVAAYPVAERRLRELGVEEAHVIDVPDFLNVPEPFMDAGYVRDHADEFETAYRSFDDDLSRDTFVAAINAKIAEDPRVLLPVVRQDHLYFAVSEFPLRHDEALLDVGGYTGDSVRDFVEISGGIYSSILSLEPFSASFRRLQETIRALGIPRARAVEVGAWDERSQLSLAATDFEIDNRIVSGGEHTIEVDRIDDIVKRLEYRPTFIKMDINGAEFRALKGAPETLTGQRPRLAVKMHVRDDFFRLPLWLRELDPGARLYLRQRNYMSMMLVLYAVF